MDISKKIILAFFTFLLSSCPNAFAEDAAVDSFTFDAGTIRNSDGLFPSINVASSDGEAWDIIIPDLIELSFHGKIQFSRQNLGYAQQAGLFLGACEQTNCGNNPLIWYKVGGMRGWSFDFNRQITADRLSSNDGNGIRDALAACNNSGQDIDTSIGRATAIQPQLTMSINTRSAVQAPLVSGEPDVATVEYNGGDHSKTAIFLIPVTCKSFNQGLIVPSGGLSVPPPGDLKIQDMRLSLRTFSNEFSQPTPGTKCKRAMLKLKIETNRTGQAKFKLSSQYNEGTIETQEITVMAKHENGRFLADFEQWIEVDKNTVFQASAQEINDDTFQVGTPWKPINLRCQSSGGGGFASPTNDE